MAPADVIGRTESALPRPPSRVWGRGTRREPQATVKAGDARKATVRPVWIPASFSLTNLRIPQTTHGAIASSVKAIPRHRAASIREAFPCSSA